MLQRTTILRLVVASAVVFSSILLPASPAAAAEVFSDGFESGDLSAWDNAAGLTVQSAVVGEGGFAARNTANVAFATKAFGTTYDELYARILLNVPTSGDTFRALKFQTSSGSDIYGVFVVADGRLRTRNYNTSTNTTSATAIHTGWNDIQARALIGGGTSQVQVWLDGVEVTDLGSTASLGTAKIGGIEIGNQISSRVHDAVYDGVVADTAFISPGPPPPPPDTPTGLQATNVTSSQVDLSWNASTDATGYTIYRDGSPIDTTSSTTYSDTTVSPSTTYDYAVDAFNAGGNSTPSAAITVTTDDPPPAPDTPTGLQATNVTSSQVDLSWNASTDATGYTIYRDGSPIDTTSSTTYSDTTVSPSTTYDYAVDAFNAGGNSTPSAAITVTTDDPPPGGGGIFSDGFESGNLSAWDASSGLNVQSAVVGEGGFAARNTANVAFATKSFGTTYDELYARILLNVPTSGDTFRALKFQTSSGSDIYGVFVVADGRLRTRNYNTSTNTTSSTAIASGWNDIQARALIGGGTSQVQVWLNGVEVTDLGSSASLGTAQIAGIEIGNQISSRVHDAVYDGVVADTAFISSGPPPPPPPAPQTPTGLQATNVTSSQVDLSWNASTGATGYTVYRNGSPLNTTTSTTYSDSTVSPSTTYSYTVDAFNAGGNSPQSTAIPVTTPAGPPSGGTAVVKAAGDIACDPSEANWNNNNGTSSKCRHKFTAQLLTGADRILTLGDQQYSCGGTQAFNQSFHPTWGQFKSIIHPILADEEYDTTGLDCGAAGPDGYFNYFGAAAGPQPGGYYSFDFNGWRFIGLNAECSDVPGGCGEGSPQNDFLEQALIGNPQCTIAMLHEPRFRSKKNGNQIGSAMLPFWQDLHAAGVEMVLSGDSHFYERFLPQDPNGNFDPTGTVQWIVGTGGKSRGGLESPSNRLPNSASATSQTFGVLELTLHQGSYEWDFLVEGSSSFSDSGSASCH